MENLEDVIGITESLLANRPKVDLHMHSFKSDGYFCPMGLVRYMQKEKKKVIALTDHDTLSGVEEAIEAGKTCGIKVIPGVEITTKYKGHNIHLLGYNININDKELNETLKKIRENRVKRAEKMVKKLSDAGIWIKFEDVVSPDSEAISKAHVAQALVFRKLSPSIKQACKDYLNEGKIAYVGYKTISTIEAIRLVLQAGGAPVIAHPGEKNLPEGLIAELVGFGLKGLEVFTPKHASETWYYMKIAEKYSLLKTCGSDFHAP